jgi:hypothetical protein
MKTVLHKLVAFVVKLSKRKRKRFSFAFGAGSFFFFFYFTNFFVYFGFGQFKILQVFFFWVVVLLKMR